MTMTCAEESSTASGMIRAYAYWLARERSKLRRM
jgi:hypothetical protein